MRGSIFGGEMVHGAGSIMLWAVLLPVNLLL